MQNELIHDCGDVQSGAERIERKPWVTPVLGKISIPDHTNGGPNVASPEGLSYRAS